MNKNKRCEFCAKYLNGSKETFDGKLFCSVKCRLEYVSTKYKFTATTR